MSIFSGFFSLGANTNKPNDPDPGEELRQGALDLLPELKLEMSDEDLIDLKRDWEKQWQKVEGELVKARQVSENYWKGHHFSNVEHSFTHTQKFGSPLVDNKIFEALETFLPIATRQNPDPIVSSDDSDEGKELAENVRKMLIYQADRLRLKLRIKRATRYWSLYFLGVAKIGWSFAKNDITTEMIRPHKIILDPEATINDDMEYTGEFIGERKQEKASSLALRFTDAAAAIKEEVKGKMGTQVGFIEWWTDEFVFWTMKDKVLDKIKNPHWNDDNEEDEVDEFGVKEKKTVAGNNHFANRKKPYVFLSIFNIGNRPYDTTSLITQNIPLQDVIDKRQRQIDINVDLMNNTMVVSGEKSGLTKEQATAFIKGARKGDGLYIETGNPNEAVANFAAPSLPADVFNQLADLRNEVGNIFGTAGSTAGGIKGEETVRGKIITRESDASRIGGGVSEYIEQFADQIYNWWVQMFMVYYTEEKSASIIGEESAREYITLQNTAFTKELTVSVKEGSLIPKDPLTQRNEAIDLFTAGAMDPITLYDKLEHPNPRKSAEKAFIWQAAPELLFQERDEADDIGEQVGAIQDKNALRQAAVDNTINPVEPGGSPTPTQGQQTPKSPVPDINAPIQ